MALFNAKGDFYVEQILRVIGTATFPRIPLAFERPPRVWWKDARLGLTLERRERAKRSARGRKSLGSKSLIRLDAYPRFIERRLGTRAGKNIESVGLLRACIYDLMEHN